MSNTIPKWFTPVVIISLIWNLLGLSAFIMQMTLTPESIALLPEAEQQLINATPFWVNIAFAIAVIGGTLGCFALLFKKTIAIPLFVLSSLSVLIQAFYGFFLSNSLSVQGPQAIILPCVIIIWTILLLLLSFKAKRLFWLK